MRLKIILKSIALHLLAAAGYCLLMPLWPGIRKDRLIVLRYHSVSDYRRHEVNVRRDAFKRQMEFLAARATPIPLKQAVEMLMSGKPLPPGAVAVTFDDGYRDNYTAAYPVLKRYGIPAAVFLTAAYIGTDTILPHDIGDDPRCNMLLSWDEVALMSGGGVDFGSHTLHHVNLGLRSIDIREELRSSKRLIEEKLGRGVWAISYPFGLVKDFSDEVKRVAREEGYISGLSAMNGVNGYDADIFELRRIGIEASDTMFTFKAKLNGALDILAIKDVPIFNNLLKLTNRAIGV